MITPQIRHALILMFTCSVIGCATDTGSFYTHPDFEPDTVRTYAWDPQGSLMEGVVPQNRQAIGDAVTTTVDEDFADRGWTLVAANDADVLVRCELGARTTQKVE